MKSLVLGTTVMNLKPIAFISKGFNLFGEKKVIGQGASRATCGSWE